jgi:hypothetical protein
MTGREEERRGGRGGGRGGEKEEGRIREELIPPSI